MTINTIYLDTLLTSLELNNIDYELVHDKALINYIEHYVVNKEVSILDLLDTLINTITLQTFTTLSINLYKMQLNDSYLKLYIKYQ